MATTKKSLNEIALNWERTVMKQTFRALNEPCAKAMVSLATKLKELGAPYMARRDISIPFKSKHAKTTRIEIDSKMIGEIQNYVRAYNKRITRAIEGMLASPNAKAWGADVFDKMIAALYKDSQVHTEEVKSLLDRAAASFESATTYERLVASAATIRGELRAMVKGLGPHLEEVAREEMGKAELRRKD